MSDIYSKTIKTMSGVNSADQPSGTVQITLPEGSTMVEIMTTEGSGGYWIRVYLDYDQIALLMIALGRVASDL
jgi:hypothetical protein